MDFLLIEFIKNILFIINVTCVFVRQYILYKTGSLKYRDAIITTAEKLVEINVLCVKIFQAISLNNNYIDEETNQILLRYTDKAPYEEEDIDWLYVIECMSDFNITCERLVPINSGMISVVFRCIKDGKDIVLKVKRRNIEEKINDGIKRVKFCLNIVSLFDYYYLTEICTVVNKNIDIIKQQINFYNEVGNIILFKNKCKYLNYVKIPEVYENVTYRYENIIAMEFIEGENINNIMIEDKKSYAKLMIKFALASILNFGLAHGDLHCGNIIFIKNDDNVVSENSIPKLQLGIIDLGIILKLDCDTKNAFIEIFSNIRKDKLERSSIKLIENLIEPKNLLKKLPVKDKDYIIKIITDVFENIIKTKKAKQSLFFENFKLFNTYFSSNKEIKKLNIRPTDEFLKIQMAVAMFNGVILDLSCDKHVDITLEVLNEIFPKIIPNFIEDDDDEDDDEDEENTTLS